MQSLNLRLPSGCAWWCKPIIPATWEAEVGESFLKVSQGKKVSKTPPQISQAWWYTSVIPVIQDRKVGG
jgi:hypothetical protein